MDTQSHAPDNLDGCYVVLLYDPDYADTSPWSVRANSRSHAIRLAINLWHAWLTDDDDEDEEGSGLPDPEVTKVYEGWISEIIECSDSGHAMHYLCPPTCGDPA